MVTPGPYPDQASFLPEHLIIPFITLVIFTIILYVLSLVVKEDPTIKNSRKETEDKFNALNDDIKNRRITDPITILQKETAIMKESYKNNKLDANSFSKENWISLVSLIATVAGAIVVPFTQLPILDYTVTGPFQVDTNGSQKFDIRIHNYGISTAENVVISLKAENINFTKFTSEPFLSNNLVYNKTAHDNIIGKALVEIGNLPPRSNVKVTATVSETSDGKINPQLITYLRSDQVVGYHNTINLIIFYGILVAFYIYVGLSFTMGSTPLTESNKIDYRLIVKVGILFCVGIFAANLILILPHIESENLLYMVYTFIGIVIIPYTLACTYVLSIPQASKA